MIATIDEDGILYLVGESPIETYAAKQWMNNANGGKFKIEVKHPDNYDNIPTLKDQS